MYDRCFIGYVKRGTEKVLTFVNFRTHVCIVFRAVGRKSAM